MLALRTRLIAFVPAFPPKNGTISQGNCVAGFTAAGAGVGAVGGAWVGGGIGGAGGAAGGTLVAPGVGTIGGGVLGAEAGAAGGALVGGGLGAGAGYAVGSIVCASRSGGGGSNFGDNQRQNKQANDARQAAERITGKRFTPAQERRFHDAITGQGLGITIWLRSRWKFWRGAYERPRTNHFRRFRRS